MIRLTIMLLATLVAGAPASGAAQSTPSMDLPEIAVPGGATGATVVCLQAGSLDGSVLVSTFLQKDSGGWEQRSNAGTFALTETRRDEQAIELVDNTRAKLVQLDFVSHTVREKDLGDTTIWSDRYVILSATDATTSSDCVSAAGVHRAGKPVRGREAVAEDRNGQRL